MRREKENFLDYTPKRNCLYEWREDENRRAEITIKNRGFFCRITQIFCHRPKETKLLLDAPGSFVWKQMDGERNIYEIGKALKQEFGEEAEPLYERLSSFIRLLHEHHFIVYTNRIKEK